MKDRKELKNERNNMEAISLPAPKHVFDDESIIKMLAVKDLDFEVKVRKTPNPFRGEGPTGFFTSYRKDTHRIFQQGLTASWKPIQNIEMLRCLADLSKTTDVELVDIRSIDGGRKICAQISLGDFDVGGGDKVSKYLCAIIAHDGTHSLSVYISPLRWWCHNQVTPSFYLAKQEGRKGKKAIVIIRHSASAKDKVKELSKAVEIAHGEFIKTENLYKKLRSVKIDENYVWDTIKKVFPLTVEEGKEATPRKKKNWEERIQDVSTRFYSADAGKTPRDTAWNLYNAIQGHMQHYGKNSDAKFESVINGKLSNDAADAIGAILEIAQGTPTSIKEEIAELVN